MLLSCGLWVKLQTSNIPFRACGDLAASLLHSVLHTSQSLLLPKRCQFHQVFLLHYPLWLEHSLLPYPSVYKLLFNF